MLIIGYWKLKKKKKNRLGENPSPKMQKGQKKLHWREYRMPEVLANEILKPKTGSAFSLTASPLFYARWCKFILLTLTGKKKSKSNWFPPYNTCCEASLTPTQALQRPLCTQMLATQGDTLSYLPTHPSHTQQSAWDSKARHVQVDATRASAWNFCPIKTHDFKGDSDFIPRIQLRVANLGWLVKCQLTEWCLQVFQDDGIWAEMQSQLFVS